MYKRFYNITVRDYNIMEQTGKISQFATSIIPAFLLKKQIKREIDKLKSELNISEDNQVEKMAWELECLTKIKAIEANLYGIVNLLQLGTEVSSYKPSLIRRDRRKIKFTNSNLRIYIERIEKNTGIQIKSLKDIDKVEKDLKLRQYRFNENFRVKKPKKQGKLYLMQVALGVFSYINQPIDVNMTVIEFIQIYKDSLERKRKEKAKP